MIHPGKKLSRLACGGLLLGGTILCGLTASTVVTQKAFANTPACDGLYCYPGNARQYCGTKCLCNPAAYTCVDNTLE